MVGPYKSLYLILIAAIQSNQRCNEHDINKVHATTLYFPNPFIRVFQSALF